LPRYPKRIIEVHENIAYSTAQHAQCAWSKNNNTAAQLIPYQQNI